MFAIDMFNEGFHLSDVGAVILLRPTVSPIIFYQQTGRCIEVNAVHTLIIFDFVNNFQKTRAIGYFVELEEARFRERERRAGVGLEKYSPYFHIFIETKNNPRNF